jgi:hypothetical protein
LVPGSRWQSQVRPAIAVTPKAAANDIRTALTIPWKKKKEAPRFS